MHEISCGHNGYDRFSTLIDPTMLPGIGVFGTGSVVKILVPLLRAKGFKVEAIWGTTYGAAAKIAEDLNIPFCTCHIDELLLRKDVDLVCITCPPNQHSQIAVKALGIGKHVLCDKPAALCQTQVLKMVHAAQYYPSLISVLAHGLRFLPAFTVMRKALLQDCYVGIINVCEAQVYCGNLINDTYDWTCDESMGGGLLSMIGSHIIDIMTFLTNQKAVRVHGILKTFMKTTSQINGIRQITADDFCTFQMEMSGGAYVTVTLHSNFPSRFKQEIFVCGTRGHLVIRGGDLYGQTNKLLKEEVLFLDVENMKQANLRIGTKANNTDNLKLDSSEVPKLYMKGLVKLIGSLKEAFAPVEDKRGWIKEPVAMAATFEDGQYIQAVIDAIRQSSRSREWVKVNILEEEVDPNPLLSAAAVHHVAISM